MFNMEKIKESAKKLGLTIIEGVEKPGFYDESGEFICTFEDAIKPILIKSEDK